MSDTLIEKAFIYSHAGGALSHIQQIHFEALYNTVKNISRKAAVAEENAHRLDRIEITLQNLLDHTINSGLLLPGMDICRL